MFDRAFHPVVRLVTVLWLPEAESARPRPVAHDGYRAELLNNHALNFELSRVRLI
jgi:hypothetical protein